MVNLVGLHGVAHAGAWVHIGSQRVLLAACGCAKAVSMNLQELRAARLEGEQGTPPQPNLLQDLLTAAIHSRAAYGYAMAAGHLSSLLNFALMQTARARFALPAVTCLVTCSSLVPALCTAPPLGANLDLRAAYGYAMAAGHLSSLLNFALMQTARPLRLHPASECLAQESLLYYFCAGPLLGAKESPHQMAVSLPAQQPWPPAKQTFADSTAVPGQNSSLIVHQERPHSSLRGRDLDATRRLFWRVQVHQFDFCAAGGASGEANNEAVSKLAGVRPEHLIMAEWNNSVGRPCHYICADLANRCLVLAIRCGGLRSVTWKV